jgi:hypothetical protein
MGTLVCIVLFGLVVFAIVLCFRTVGKPRPRLARAGLILAIVILALGAFALLPEALLAPQTLGSEWFRAHLTSGMSRADVDALRRRTFGSAFGSLGGAADLPNLAPSSSVQYVWYTLGVAPCVEWGQVYQLRYDGAGRLQSWQNSGWGDGC